MKIVKDKQKADVIYYTKYDTEEDLRVVTGKDSEGFTVTKVKTKGQVWSIPQGTTLLKMQDDGNGFEIKIPATSPYDLEDRNFYLDYSDALNLLVALQAELIHNGSRVKLNWKKTKEKPEEVKVDYSI